MCVQTPFKKCRSWEIITIVDFLVLKTPSSQRIELISRLLVGSSNKRTSGSEKSACAKRTLSFQPGAISLIRP